MQDNVSNSGGLREQKRRQTKEAIEDAATRLVDEHGFPAVTIEQICEDAGISRRTFFNYFDTKDEAVLGTSEELFNAPTREAFLHTPSDNVVRTILELTFEHVAAREESPHIRERRMRIVQSNDVAALVMHRKRQTAFDLIDLVEKHFEHCPHDRRLPEVTGRREAAIIGGLVRESIWVSMREGSRDAALNTAQHITDYAKGLTW